MSWFRKSKTPMNTPIPPTGAVPVSTPPTIINNHVHGIGIPTAGVAAAAPAGIAGIAHPAPGHYLVGGGSSAWTPLYSPAPSPNVLTLNNNGKEIVKLTNSGKVEWAAEIEIDEAAEAFARSLSLGAEIAAGISKNVKIDMRDSVFNDLIAIAEEKGSLTAEDLKYLLGASKIVEKLKGGHQDRFYG